MAGAPCDCARVALAHRDRARWRMRRPPPAQLWAGPPDPKPRTLPDILEKKPGAVAGSTPLEQWRQAGRWPDCLDRIWKKLEERHGKSGGTREMIGLVRVGPGSGCDRLISAVEEALRLGVSDEAAVLHIMRTPDAEERRRCQLALSEELAQFERPQPVMDEYDLLLTRKEVIQ